MRKGIYYIDNIKGNFDKLPKKEKYLLSTVLMALILVLVVVGGSFATKLYTTKNKSLNVEVSCNKVEEKGKVKVFVTSNLPDNTEIMVSITNEWEDEEEEYSVYESDKVIVKDGKCETKWFGESIEGLKKGSYEITINTILPNLQPEDVQKVMGENGEYLTGIYVEKSKVDDNRIVIRNETINVQGPLDNEEIPSGKS